MRSKADLAAQREFRHKVITVVVIVLAAIAVLWLASQLRSLLFMVFVSLFVAVAVAPPVQWLERRGMKRGLATGVVFLAGFLLVVGFGWALAPLFVEQVQQLIEGVPGYVEAFVAWLQRLGFDIDWDPEELGGQIAAALENFGGGVVGGVVGVAGSVFGFLVFATTVALFSFFMVAELPKMQRTVLSTMPENRQHRALHAWNVAVDQMGSYIYSRLVLAVLSGVVAWGALSILGVPFALSLGIWVGVLSQFIPVVGTYLAMVLPIIVSLTTGGLTTTIWVVVVFVAYQQVENYLFAPFITKKTMEIHPAVSVGAILAGASLMGGIGVVLALPMTGIIQALISESRRSYDTILDDEHSEGSDVTAFPDSAVTE